MCQTITGFFDGIFRSKNPIVPKTKAQFQVIIQMCCLVRKKMHFQIRLHANQTDRTVYTLIDNWNEKVATSRDFLMGHLAGMQIFYSCKNPKLGTFRCKIGKVCKTKFEYFSSVYLLRKIHSRRKFIIFLLTKNSLNFQIELNHSKKFQFVIQGPQIC
jgi:hypothetical protein